MTYTSPMQDLQVLIFNKKTQEPSFENLSDNVRKGSFEIIQHPKFLDLSFPDIKDFLSLTPTVEATPSQLLGAVLQWAEQERKRLFDDDMEGKLDCQKEQLQALIDLIDLKEATLDQLTQLSIDSGLIRDVIGMENLEKNQSQKKSGVEEAYICGKNVDNGVDCLVTCHSVNISSVVSKADNQSVYSKKIKLSKIAVALQILFQINPDYAGYVTLILTMLGSDNQVEIVRATVVFLDYDTEGNPNGIYRLRKQDDVYERIDIE